MHPKQMEDWPQRIPRDLTKAKKQRHQNNLMRLLQEKNASSRAHQIKNNQISSKQKNDKFQAELNQLQIKHVTKMQHLHEARKLYEALNQHAQVKNLNFKTQIRTKTQQKKLRTRLNILKNSENYIISRFRMDITLRKKLLKKKKRKIRTTRKIKRSSRIGSSKAITAHKTTPSKNQAKIIHPIQFASTSLLLKHSFFSLSTDLKENLALTRKQLRMV
jgi:hypothetical protein